MATNSTGTVGTTAATVAVSHAGSGKKWLYVTNRSANDLTFTVDGTTATDGGDDMHYVAPVVGAFTRVRVGGSSTSVSIIASSASSDYSIQVAPVHPNGT